MNPYTYEQAAIDASRIAGALRYFPRRDSNLLADVIVCLAESCQTQAQAENAVRACQAAERYESLDQLRALIASAANQPAEAEPEPPWQVPTLPPECQPCPIEANAGPLPPEKLPDRLRQVEARCPHCPFIPTLRVLIEADREIDAQAQQRRRKALLPKSQASASVADSPTAQPAKHPAKPDRAADRAILKQAIHRAGLRSAPATNRRKSAVKKKQGRK